MNIKLLGDKTIARKLVPFAEGQLTILREHMKLAATSHGVPLKQQSRRVVFADGSVIVVNSVFGIDSVSIFVPVVTTTTSKVLEVPEVEDAALAVMVSVEPYSDLIAEQALDTNILSVLAAWSNDATSATLSSGTHDWRGTYTPDGPAVVLSWAGGASRIAPDGFGMNVYQNGAVVKVSPESVVYGAAIQSANRKIIVAVKDSSNNDMKFYQCTQGGSPTPGTYNAVTNPDGWELLYTEPYPSFAKVSAGVFPIFFNPAGSLATTSFRDSAWLQLAIEIDFNAGMSEYVRYYDGNVLRTPSLVIDTETKTKVVDTVVTVNATRHVDSDHLDMGIQTQRTSDISVVNSVANTTLRCNRMYATDYTPAGVLILLVAGSDDLYECTNVVQQEDFYDDWNTTTDVHVTDNVQSGVSTWSKDGFVLGTIEEGGVFTGIAGHGNSEFGSYSENAESHYKAVVGVVTLDTYTRSFNAAHTKHAAALKIYLADLRTKMLLYRIVDVETAYTGSESVSSSSGYVAYTDHKWYITKQRVETLNISHNGVGTELVRHNDIATADTQYDITVTDPPIYFVCDVDAGPYPWAYSSSSSVTTTSESVFSVYFVLSQAVVSSIFVGTICSAGDATWSTSFYYSTITDTAYIPLATGYVNASVPSGLLTALALTGANPHSYPHRFLGVVDLVVLPA